MTRVLSVLSFVVCIHLLIGTARAHPVIPATAMATASSADFSDEPEFQQWWEDVWNVPYDHDMFIVAENMDGTAVGPHTLATVHLVQYQGDEQPLQYIATGQIGKLRHLPIDPIVHDPLDVVVEIVNTPGEPEPLHIQGTIEREEFQWAATITGPNGVITHVVVSADVLQLSYNGVQATDTFVLLFPIRDFPSLADLDEFVASAHAFAGPNQISGGDGSGPGGTNCDEDDIICFQCAPLDNCQKLAWDKYRISVAGCGSVNGGLWAAMPMGLIGAGVGSVVPVIGTAVGGGIGGLIGLIGGSEWGRRDCLKRAMRTLETESTICWENHDPFPNTPNEQHPCIDRWLLAE